MKTIRVLTFLSLILLLAGVSSYFSSRRSSSPRERKKEVSPAPKPHPLDLIPSLPNQEALELRRAKDLLLYGKPEEAVKILQKEFKDFPCWRDYFLGLSLQRLGKEDGWSVLADIPDGCPSRGKALAYILANAPVEVLKAIPPSELHGKDRVELEYKLGLVKPERIFCEYPDLAEKFRIRLRKVSKKCREKRYAYFFSRGWWSRAYREGLTPYQKARAAFRWRRYRRVASLLRKPKTSGEVLLLFRSYLRLGYVSRARRMRKTLERFGLGQEYLWKMAMYYYPREKGFQIFKTYLKKYPTGKYSEQARTYLDLRRKCLHGEGVDEEEIQYVEFSLPEVSPGEKEVVRRAGYLSSAFLYQEALEELKTALGGKDSPFLKYYLGVVYYRAGEYLKGLKAIVSALGGLPDDPRTLRLIYPFPMRKKIENLALLNGLDPFLVAALIHQESLFNSSARSYAGAVGLMQMTPGTFSSTASRMGAGFSNLWDPHENLVVGIRHFSELLNYYRGRVEYALAAYNAGIKRVDRWRSYLPCPRASTFVELIPIEQTKKYVKSIKRKWKIYRRLYGEDRTDFRRTLLGARHFNNIR